MEVTSYCKVNITGLAECLEGYSENWNGFVVKKNAEQVETCKGRNLNDLEPFLRLGEPEKSVSAGNTAIFVAIGLLCFGVFLVLVAGGVYVARKFLLSPTDESAKVSKDGGRKEEMPMSVA